MCLVFSVSIIVLFIRTVIMNRVMDDSVNEKPFYIIYAVMFDSKKKKNPNSQIEEKEYEENNKGKKVIG